MTKQIKVGDPVLFYGRTLYVTELFERGGHRLARVHDREGLKAREEARAALQEFRAEQATLDTSPKGPGEAKARWHEIRERIEKIDEVARQWLVQHSIRVDLLSFWEEKGVWVSDGRILSGEQLEYLQKKLGMRKPTAKAQRQALLFLEARAAPAPEPN